MLGIDLSSMTVKLLALSRDDDRYRAHGYAIVPVSLDALTDDQTTYAETVGAFHEELLNRTKPLANLSVAAVSGADVIIKTAAMPAEVSEEDLETQLTVEADQYIRHTLLGAFLKTRNWSKWRKSPCWAKSRTWGLCLKAPRILSIRPRHSSS